MQESTPLSVPPGAKQHAAPLSSSRSTLLLSLNAPPANTALFNCCLLLLTLHSSAALSYSQQRGLPPLSPPPCLKCHPHFNQQCPCLFLTLHCTEKRGTHVSRNTSEHESATTEQRRYRAALISALLKPAAILKLFLCLSIPPTFLSSNILPLPLPPPSPLFLSVSQGSSFPLFSSPLSLRVQWLTAQYTSIIHGCSIRFTGKTNHRWSHC